jgi:molybdenum cofactor synthesis domain-containing protein
MDLTEARQLASRLAAPLGIERVRIEEALGRVVAQRIAADRNLPGECRSRLDGFALQSDDTRNAAPGRPVSLRILTGCIAAGHTVDVGIGSKECIRILTGAPFPPSADAVAAQEDVTVRGDELVLERACDRGNGVAFPGEEVKEGEFLLAEGEVLTPTRLAVMVALGYEWIAVRRQPRVALLATGDEVKTLGSCEDGPFTYCNNMHLLSWLTPLQGGRATPLGVVGDDPRAIADLLQDTGADLVITTGGMGKGDRDFVLEAWKLLGVETLFSEINLTPGRKSALGVRGRQVFLGLPGNPWAAQVVFDELAAPMLRRWQGLKEFSDPLVAACLKESVRQKPGYYRAIRGILDLAKLPALFSPCDRKQSSVCSRLDAGFAYVILEPHVVEVARGAEVRVRLSGFPILASPLFRVTRAQHCSPS